MLVTVSMAGEKLLLVIGKSANPKCFKNIKKLLLPYKSNKKAWMTAAIFETWVKKTRLANSKKQLKHCTGA